MTEIRTGTDALRAAVATYARKGHLSPLSRDVGVGVAALDSFAHAQGGLTPAVMSALAKDLLDAEYDEEHDLLRPRKKVEPKSLGISPPPIDPATLPVFDTSPPPRGPQPVNPVRVPPQKQQRPGWVGEEA